MNIDDIEVLRPTCVMVIESEKAILYAHFEKNPLADALKEKLNEGPVALATENNDGNAAVGILPWELPKNDAPLKTKPGDVIVSRGNRITVCFDEKDFSGTVLARVGSSIERLVDALGGKEAKMKLGLEWGE